MGGNVAQHEATARILANSDSWADHFSVAVLNTSMRSFPEDAGFSVKLIKWPAKNRTLSVVWFETPWVRSGFCSHRLSLTEYSKNCKTPNESGIVRSDEGYDHSDGG